MINLSVNADISSLIDAFDQDRDRTLTAIYKNYRSSFIAYARQLSQDEELVIDCFQEAVISLYENLAIGKINDQQSTIKTYLYAIGKHKVLNATKKKKTQAKMILVEEEGAEQQTLNDEQEYQKSLIAKAFNGLGGQCKEILTKYYYERYSIEAIMISMKYKNQNTVKAHKSRCMAQLREIINTIKNL